MEGFTRRLDTEEQGINIIKQYGVKPRDLKRWGITMKDEGRK